MKLKHKVLGLVLCMGILPAVAWGATFIGLSAQESADKLAMQTKIGQTHLERINGLVYAVVMDSRGIYMSPDTEKAKQFGDGILRNLKELDATAQQLLATGLDVEAQSIAQVRKYIDEFIAFRSETVRLGREESPAAARAQGDNDANRANRQKLNSELKGLAARYEQHVAESLAQSQSIGGVVFNISLVGVALAVIGTVLGIVLSLKGIAAPIEGIKLSILSLARGETDKEIFGAQRKDEIGEIADALQVFKNNLLETERLRAEADAERARNEEARRQAEQAEAERLRVEAEMEKKRTEDARMAEEETIRRERQMVADSIGAGLAKLAAKDLTCRMTGEMPEAYRGLQANFNAALEQIEKALQSVTGSSHAIHSGTEEIAAASDDLSRRTEQQAASLEETAAALNEITSTVKKSADGAKHACEIVTTAKADAETSAAVVRRTVEAMNGIEKSSQQISQIIGVIDEIAFQTNLLALNAGVEAARAGDSGRGFAVVASEVRALAQRSAEAAKQIKGLISTSTTQVGQGVALVAETGKSLERILAQVAEIDTVVSVIAAGAQEQATSVQEVNTAINQMDRVTQQNAAMVEESTAACHALSQETTQLSRLIGQFHVGRAAAVKPARVQTPRFVPDAMAS